MAEGMVEVPSDQGSGSDPDDNVQSTNMEQTTSESLQSLSYLNSMQKGIFGKQNEWREQNGLIGKAIKK